MGAQRNLDTRDKIRAPNQSNQTFQENPSPRTLQLDLIVPVLSRFDTTICAGK